jgi:hypothetical protein
VCAGATPALRAVESWDGSCLLPPAEAAAQAAIQAAAEAHPEQNQAALDTARAAYDTSHAQGTQGFTTVGGTSKYVIFGQPAWMVIGGGALLAVGAILLLKR